MIIDIQNLIISKCVFNLRIGESLEDSFFENKNIVPSNELNKNGTPVLFNLRQEGLNLSIGIDEFDKISYIMINLLKSTDHLSFEIKGNYFNGKIDFNTLIELLEINYSDWFFEDSISKVLKIKIRTLELIYSFENSNGEIEIIQIR